MPIHMASMHPARHPRHTHHAAHAAHMECVRMFNVRMCRLPCARARSGRCPSITRNLSFATSNPRDTASNDIYSTHHCLKQVACNGCSRSHPLSTVMASGSRCRQQHHLRPRRVGRTALSARTTLWQWCGRQAKAVLIVESCTVLPTRC
jgi:hypothetical protein